ncbi:hypothetical protein [Streptomyces sp. BA2]|uniref:hypothetical protein n=1 Tax=Streptomyces sp. BA2 TaxID=436595 RepID=UPI001325A961|nr:hypothetical protein [Streptomyces sp. BA2]MWA12252.1 hypothetical protein [Streptomyces sp. BA2]
MNPRLIALMGVVAITVLLPLAGASAGPVGDGDAEARSPERPADAAPGAAPDPDAKQPSTEKPTSKRSSTEGASREGASTEGASSDDRPTDSSSFLTGLGLDNTAQCGPELTSPKGIEAQTCVLTQGHDTWGRTYYRNTTGDELSAVLTVMAPGGRTVQMHCAVGAADEPGACETPRERTAGNAEEYSAVVEFADGSGGPLLLRSGSNSARPKAS